MQSLPTTRSDRGSLTAALRLGRKYPIEDCRTNSVSAKCPCAAHCIARVRRAGRRDRKEWDLCRFANYERSPRNFEMRLALESTAAFLAAVGRNGRPSRRGRENAGADWDVADIMLEQRVGWVFHQALFAAARTCESHPRIVYCGQTLALNELPRSDAETVRRGTIEHLKIFHAIEANDGELARQHMWNHIVDGTPARIKLLKARHEHEK